MDQVRAVRAFQTTEVGRNARMFPQAQSVEQAWQEVQAVLRGGRRSTASSQKQCEFAGQRCPPVASAMIPQHHERAEKADYCDQPDKRRRIMNCFRNHRFS